VTSDVGGGAQDTIIQAQAATDARGITTARVRPTTPPHDVQFSARVVEDKVDIAQVVEIVVQKPEPPSFFAPAFAPYFDGLHFVVSPLPLKVGQATEISLPLTNRRKVPVEVRARFFGTVPNIGLGHWPLIGETETLVLKPGESLEAKITWTPTVETGHICQKVEVWGRELPPQTTHARSSGWPHMVRTAFAQLPTPVPSPSPPSTRMDTKQQNIGPVTCPIPPSGGGEDLQCDYTISTGHLACVDPATDATIIDSYGWAGFRQYKNDPNAQARRNEGPIPEGIYYITDSEKLPTINPPPKTGEISLEIIPLTSNRKALGRDAFRMHGPNRDPRRRDDSSHGCIIMSPDVREIIQNYGGAMLFVER
jgi:hypothetical protein